MWQNSKNRDRDRGGDRDRNRDRPMPTVDLCVCDANGALLPVARCKLVAHLGDADGAHSDLKRTSGRLILDRDYM